VSPFFVSLFRSFFVPISFSLNPYWLSDSLVTRSLVFLIGISLNRSSHLEVGDTFSKEDLITLRVDSFFSPFDYSPAPWELSRDPLLASIFSPGYGKLPSSSCRRMVMMTLPFFSPFSGFSITSKQRLFTDPKSSRFPIRGSRILLTCKRAMFLPMAFLIDALWWPQPHD